MGCWKNSLERWKIDRRGEDDDQNNYLVISLAALFINIIVISTMTILQFIIGLVNEIVDFKYVADGLNHLLEHNNIFFSYVSLIPIALAAISLLALYEYRNFDNKKTT